VHGFCSLNAILPQTVGKMSDVHSQSSTEPSTQGNSATVFQFDLNSLLETSKVLNSSDNLQFILSHILRTVMGKPLLTRACIINRIRKTWKKFIV